MASFCLFLSPRHPFVWTPELDQAFQSSKAAIANAIREGVEIFDLEKPTCLHTDCLKKGVRYFLLQETLQLQETLHQLQKTTAPGAYLESFFT